MYEGGAMFKGIGEYGEEMQRELRKDFCFSNNDRRSQLGHKAGPSCGGTTEDKRCVGILKDACQ